VQPGPVPVAGRGAQGGRQGGETTAAGGGRGGQNQAPSPFGAGCGGAGGGGGGGGGGFGGAGGGNPGPYVLAGTYHVSLVVDGTTVETKPLRVLSDPEVVLTEAERRKLFDMAMEMHSLQIRAAEAGNELTPFNARLAELAREVASRDDIPADVKGSIDTLSKEAAALTPKLVPPVTFGRGGGGGGGGRGGAPETPVARAGQAKNALMGGMWPTEQIMKAYAEAKTELPKAIAEANAVFSRGAALSTSLARFKVALSAPAPVAAKPAKGAK